MKKLHLAGLYLRMDQPLCLGQEGKGMAGEDPRSRHRRWTTMEKAQNREHRAETPKTRDPVGQMYTPSHDPGGSPMVWVPPWIIFLGICHVIAPSFHNLYQAPLGPRCWTLLSLFFSHHSSEWVLLTPFHREGNWGSQSLPTHHLYLFSASTNVSQGPAIYQALC